MLCEATTATCSSNEAGVEFGEDGSLYKLYADSAGQVYRGLGWGRRGRYAVWDTSVMNGPGFYQLNVSLDGEPLNEPRPEFQMSTPTPRLLLGNAQQGCSAYYQKIAP